MCAPANTHRHWRTVLTHFSISPRAHLLHCCLRALPAKPLVLWLIHTGSMTDQQPARAIYGLHSVAVAMCQAWTRHYLCCLKGSELPRGSFRIDCKVAPYSETQSADNTGLKLECSHANCTALRISLVNVKHMFRLSVSGHGYSGAMCHE